MILAAVLGLEFLGWETRVAVAVPNAVREEAFEGDFLDGGVVAATSEATSAAASKHDGVEWGGGEAWFWVPWMGTKTWRQWSSCKVVVDTSVLLGTMISHALP